MAITHIDNRLTFRQIWKSPFYINGNEKINVLFDTPSINNGLFHNNCRTSQFKIV